MTLAELLAMVRGTLGAGFAQTGRALTSAAQKDRRTIQRGLTGLKDAYRGAGEQFEDIKRDSSLGRLIGKGVGFLVGGAPLASILGTVGSEVGRAGRKVKSIPTELADTTFFQGGREKFDASKADLNRFISRANASFSDSLISNAISDFITSSQLERAGITPEKLRSIPGFARSTDAEGNVLGLRRGVQSAFTGSSAEDLIASLTGGRAQQPEISLRDFLPAGRMMAAPPNIAPLGEDEALRRLMMYEGFR
jgi:hypothetical protein